MLLTLNRSFFLWDTLGTEKEDWYQNRSPHNRTQIRRKQKSAREGGMGQDQYPRMAVDDERREYATTT